MLKFLELNAEKKTILTIILFTILVLLVPHLLRYISNEPLLSGDKAYFYSRISESALENKKIYDDLNDKPVYPVGWPLVLTIFSFVFRIPVSIISILLPILLGVFCILLFYYILNKLGINLKVRMISTIVLAISPPFLFLFSTSNTYAFPVFLLLLSFYLALNNKLFSSGVLIVLSSLFGFLNVIIALALFFVYTFLRDKKYVRFLYLSLSVVFFSFLLYLPYLLNFGLPEKLNFSYFEDTITFRFQNFVSDLGGKMGLGIFTILLSFLGFIASWRMKTRYSFLYVSVLILLLISFFKLETILYLNLFLCFLAAYAIVVMADMKWESKLIKNLTILILVCGLIFSGLSYINESSKTQPNKDEADGLNFLRTRTNGVVFSYYSRGALISEISEKPVVLDSFFTYTPNVNERWSDSQKLFYTEDIRQAEKILDKYNIRYVFVDKKMKEGLIWDTNDDGLLFLLRFNKRFKNVYNINEIEVWEYN